LQIKRPETQAFRIVLGFVNPALEIDAAVERFAGLLC
jgi:hypothetical protein